MDTIGKNSPPVMRPYGQHSHVVQQTVINTLESDRVQRGALRGSGSVHFNGRQAGSLAPGIERMASVPAKAVGIMARWFKMK